MKFHDAKVRRDRRTRLYIPVERVLRSDHAVDSQRLVGNENVQFYIAHEPESTELKPGGDLILDFGKALHGGVRLNSGSAGRVCLRLGESVSEVLYPPNQDHSRLMEDLCLPKMGTLEYGNTVFRFARIINVGQESILFQNIMAVALEMDLDITGSFRSSDGRLNDIWMTAVRTVQLCMQDYIYDGGKRDRLVWMGDMHPEARGIFAAFSDVSLIRDTLQFMIDTTPVERHMNGISTYNCWLVINVWEYFWATGQMDFLQRNADYLEQLINRYAAYVDSQGRECLPHWTFLDWPSEDNPEEKHAGLQALLVWMMDCGGKVLRQLGRHAEAAQNARQRLLTHVPECHSKVAAALMTLAGLADHSDFLERNPTQGVSTFMGYYMLRAKKTVPALRLIREYWGAMLDAGATSFWEDFNLDWIRNATRIDEFPQPGKDDLHRDFGAYCYKGLRHSLSHGWSCGPAPFLSERVLGVRILEPGAGKVLVRPDLGDLEFVEGTYPTCRGIIGIFADKTGKCVVDAPEGIDIIRK